MRQKALKKRNKSRKTRRQTRRNKEGKVVEICLKYADFLTFLSLKSFSGLRVHSDMFCSAPASFSSQRASQFLLSFFHPCLCLHRDRKSKLIKLTSKVNTDESFFSAAEWTLCSHGSHTSSDKTGFHNSPL